MFIMKDDMKSSSLPSEGPEILKHLEQISHFKMDMRRIKRWAYSEIKFLVFDDTDIIMNGYDSDDEEGMLEYATKVSIGQEYDASSTQSTQSFGNPSTLPLLTSDQYEPPEGGLCSICPRLPYFPVHRKVRKFRLVSPQDILPIEAGKNSSIDIRHYFAVSYFWPKDEEGNPIQVEKTHQIREGHGGTTRGSRAPDYILDRAVDLAISYGLRLIWIDQECLPQDDDDEYHRLGVQAMDIVYNRALVTGGFLDVKVTSQIQIDAIEALSQSSTNGTSNITANMLSNVLNLMRSINNDKWYKRAWVVQEALCAGSRMVLCLNRGEGVLYASAFRAGNGQDPRITYEENRRMHSTNVAISIGMFHDVLRAANSLLSHQFKVVGNALVRFHDDQTPVEIIINTAVGRALA
jgi:hypothetical protein